MLELNMEWNELPKILQHKINFQIANKQFIILFLCESFNAKSKKELVLKLFIVGPINCIITCYQNVLNYFAGTYDVTAVYEQI